MPKESRVALMQYRFEQSQGCLNDAKRDIEAQSYKAATNRSYYCIFHAMRAILALDEFDSKTHPGVITKFRQLYIKTGLFPTDFSDMIQRSWNNRGKSDYEDFFIISKELAVKQIKDAEVFLLAIEEYIKTILPKTDAEQTPDVAVN